MSRRTKWRWLLDSRATDQVGNGEMEEKEKKEKKMWPRKIADPTADCDGVSLFPAVVVVRVACARLELRTLPVY